jgi:Protein of unknown function (DUF3147)
MRIQLDISVLRETRWYQLAVRFLFGGLVTAATGIIARKYGPSIGGLFLAFPAIFPASATLIERHEKEKKEREGLHGAVRARKAVGVDAAGAAIGSIGLFVFALLIARFLSNSRPSLLIVASTLCWMLVSGIIWYVRKRA